MTIGSHVQTTSLRKRFGATEVLRGVDLEVEQGAFVAVIGRSGCGKSTLLRLLAGLDAPSEGAIALNGTPLRGLHPHARVMFQDARLLLWKRVIDNVGLGMTGQWRPRALGALADVGLADRAGDWPAILSGGQRQRVALARALVSDPGLLLLDEPLGALDALTRIEMQQLLERLWQEQRFTAILVTHDVEEAISLADRVILLEQGAVALDLSIDLPRPRHRGDPRFARLVEQVVDRVLGESLALTGA
ncbi:MAG TPA: ATP-binding cassette domain-containing protein [Roseiflexaceae bacterium]|nr:ATP-binding cassette domain-containing protein [Roseiflexaceae bacterium]